MNNSFSRAQRVLWLVGLMSFFCVGLVAFRMGYTQCLDYGFLVWNLTLAWVPLLAAYALRQPLARRRGASLVLGAVWLLFLPNAPYLLTDFVHLGQFGGIRPYFDAFLLFTFALTGLLAGVVSTHWVHRTLDGWLSARVSSGVVAGCLGLAGYGVYLGRELRYNSWDVLTSPGPLLQGVATSLSQPTALAHTLLFGTFFGLAYLLLRGFLATVDAPRPASRLEKMRYFANE